MPPIKPNQISAAVYALKSKNNPDNYTESDVLLAIYALPSTANPDLIKVIEKFGSKPIQDAFIARSAQLSAPAVVAAPGGTLTNGTQLVTIPGSNTNVTPVAKPLTVAPPAPSSPTAPVQSKGDKFINDRLDILEAVIKDSQPDLDLGSLLNASSYDNSATFSQLLKDKKFGTIGPSFELSQLIAAKTGVNLEDEIVKLRLENNEADPTNRAKTSELIEKFISRLAKRNPSSDYSRGVIAPVAAVPVVTLDAAKLEQIKNSNEFKKTSKGLLDVFKLNTWMITDYKSLLTELERGDSITLNRFTTSINRHASNFALSAKLDEMFKPLMLTSVSERDRNIVVKELLLSLKADLSK